MPREGGMTMERTWVCVRGGRAGEWHALVTAARACSGVVGQRLLCERTTPVDSLDVFGFASAIPAEAGEVCLVCVRVSLEAG